MDNKSQHQDKLYDFSLIAGGPLYQFYIRSWLLKPPLKLYKRRIVAISLLAWLPLLLLSLMSGLAVNGVKVPFIYDIETHVRFLGSLALLVGAELFVHERMRLIIPQFVEHDLVTSEYKQQFISIIDSAMRLRNSVVAELLLVVLAATCGHWFWEKFMALKVATWYALPADQLMKLTPAGYWYVFIGIPLFQFIGFRWYYRFIIWYRFLWQVARLPLRFNVLHPDRVGGLGFLVNSMFAFAPVLVAHTLLLAGIITNHIWYEGATLMQFKLEILAVLLLTLLLVILPLTFFVIRLAQAKRMGLREYSMVASHYVNNFRRKWIHADTKTNNDILGTPDIQSLADLSNSYNVAREMSFFPFGRQAIFVLMVIVAIPFLPLLFTLVPVDELIGQLVKVIL